MKTKLSVVMSMLACSNILFSIEMVTRFDSLSYDIMGVK